MANKYCCYYKAIKKRIEGLIHRKSDRKKVHEMDAKKIKEIFRIFLFWFRNATRMKRIPLLWPYWSYNSKFKWKNLVKTKKKLNFNLNSQFILIDFKLTKIATCGRRKGGSMGTKIENRKKNYWFLTKFLTSF